MCLYFKWYALSQIVNYTTIKLHPLTSPFTLFWTTVISTFKPPVYISVSCISGSFPFYPIKLFTGKPRKVITVTLHRKEKHSFRNQYVWPFVKFCLCVSGLFGVQRGLTCLRMMTQSEIILLSVTWVRLLSLNRVRENNISSFCNECFINSNREALFLKFTF